MDYCMLNRQLAALTEDCPYRMANLSNAAALLFEELKDINWAGFYELRGDRLILGPFQGKPACTVIPVGSGVCGAAVREERLQRVEDVHQFPGHIACDSASNSELVIPLYEDGRLWGVLDIDSPLTARFAPEDAEGLQAFARGVSGILDRCRD